MSLNSWVLDTSSNCGNGTVIRNVETNEEYTYDFASSPVSGIPHPNFIKEENVKALREQLVFRDSDVFVCTYSKSGTTLMEQIVLLLQNNGDATKLNPLHKNTYDRTTKAGKIWCEMSVFPDGISGSNPEAKKACMGENKSLMTVQEFDSLSNRLIKTHAPKDLFLGLKDVEHENKVIKTTSLEFVQGIKIIYVSRNPFDACVSCYYHPKPGVSPESNGCPFPAFAKLWLSERIEFGGWSNHISGWRQLYHSDMNYSMSNKSIPQILWISYEELVTHTKSSISKVAAFLEIDASSTLIENVMEGCKFESVKRSAEILMKDGMDGNLNHLRKGKVGDWRNHFTPELKEEFGQQLKENIPNGLDVIFDIGDGMKWNIEVRN